MDQDTAQQLFYRYAALVLLDAPQGLEFGIDYSSWTIGPRFQGVKMIPPGVHLVYYSITDKLGQASLRNGFLRVFKERERIIRRWNQETEDFEPVDTANHAIFLENNDAQQEDLLRTFDPNLAPYPMNDQSYKVWKQLSSYVTPQVAQRILPDHKRILDITQPDEDNNDLDRLTSSNDTEETTTSDYGFVTLNVRRSYRKGATGAELTQHMMDKSWLLESTIEQYFHGDYQELLGEMQLAFILLLLGQNYSGLEQWKRIMYLICGSEQALEHRGSTLYSQLEECPPDFFYDLLSADNFIAALLKTLFSNVAQQRDTTSQDTYPASKKFNWAPLLEEPQEDDEDAPVVVEL
ncbi:A1 cistron-splicing factor [Syncephalis plumigaleata]|nr:A1 cistron-splicing factor [Syncephalis plumigaleata]